MQGVPKEVAETNGLLFSTLAILKKNINIVLKGRDGSFDGRGEYIFKVKTDGFVKKFITRVENLQKSVLNIFKTSTIRV